MPTIYVTQLELFDNTGARVNNVTIPPYPASSLLPRQLVVRPGQIYHALAWYAAGDTNRPLQAGPASSFLTFETPQTSIAAPTGLAAGTATSTTIPLTWNIVTGASAYEINYRAASETEGQRVKLTGGSTAAHTLTGLTAGTQYFIAIRSFNSNDLYGLWSGTITATTTA